MTHVFKNRIANSDGGNIVPFVSSETDMHEIFSRLYAISPAMAGQLAMQVAAQGQFAHLNSPASAQSMEAWRSMQAQHALTKGRQPGA